MTITSILYRKGKEFNNCSDPANLRRDIFQWDWDSEFAVLLKGQTRFPGGVTPILVPWLRPCMEQTRPPARATPSLPFVTVELFSSLTFFIFFPIFSQPCYVFIFGGIEFCMSVIQNPKKFLTSTLLFFF